MPDVDLPLPFEAYAGDEPFLFVSYAHKDSHLVFPELQRLRDGGFRVWYDEGIDPGNEWPEEVAKALTGASLFLVFITNNSANSRNVRNEINFALNSQKPFIAVHLTQTDLPGGLCLRMGDIQAILKYRMTDEGYGRKLEKTLPALLRTSMPSADTIPSGQPKTHEAKASKRGPAAQPQPAEPLTSRGDQDFGEAPHTQAVAMAAALGSIVAGHAATATPAAAASTAAGDASQAEAAESGDSDKKDDRLGMLSASLAPPARFPPAPHLGTITVVGNVCGTPPLPVRERPELRPRIGALRIVQASDPSASQPVPAFSGLETPRLGQLVLRQELTPASSGPRRAVSLTSNKPSIGTVLIRRREQ